MVALRVLASHPRLKQLPRSYSGRNSSFILSVRFLIGSSFVPGQLSSTDDSNPSVAFTISGRPRPDNPMVMYRLGRLSDQRRKNVQHAFEVGGAGVAG